MGAQAIRVILADDHAVVRQGLREVIEKDAGLVVVAETGHAHVVADLVAAHDCDVLLLDLTMPPGSGGFGVMDELARRDLGVRILVLSIHDEPAYVERALGCGAHGYLAKRVGAAGLRAALRVVADGGTVVDLGGPPVLAEEEVDDPPSDLHTLSKREREVLQLVASGHTNRASAERLGISIKTVEGYRRRVVHKLGASGRADLVKHAMRLGLLGPHMTEVS